MASELDLGIMTARPLLFHSSAAARCASGLAMICALGSTIGCKTIPPGRSSVDAVAIRGAEKVDDGEIEDKLATTPSSKFLGLFRGFLYEYSVFDRFVLQRDLARVEAFYRSKGYYEAHARAGRIHAVDDKHVEVEILVEEGQAVNNRNVRIEGLEGLPEDVTKVVKKAANELLVSGKPFEEEAFEKAEGAVRRALTDRGFAYAKVKSDAAVDIVRRTADVTFVVTVGPPCFLGPVTIEGLGPLPEKPVRRALDLAPGEPFSEEALESAQQAVLDLGVFASVDIRPDLPDPPRPDRVVPVKVTVEPSRLRTVRLGGGAEFDALKTDIHGVVGWEHRNLFGGMRKFAVTFRPGLVLYPMRINNIVFPNHFFPEERLRLEFRQPGFPEARTNLFVRPQFDIYPVLINPNPPEDAPVLGYAEFRNAIGLDRVLWKFFAAISHNVQVAYPFSYLGPRDPTLGTLLISYPELLTHLDLRDDRIHPRKGVFIGNTLEYAGGPFGGQAQDVKVQPEIRGYVPLSRRVVIASRASVGFLWPRNYGSFIQNPRSEFENTVERTRDFQLTFFRGFFSGGPTSNRGYPLRGVGPHDFVPFLSPDVALQQLDRDCGGDVDCRSPTGGFTLWEASMELRYAVTGPISLATFCDASDVSPRVNDIRLSHLHLSCGAGARYDTPAGPIRLDIGYRLPGLQVIGGLTPDEREPQTFAFGIPIAVHIGIGEAY